MNTPLLSEHDALVVHIYDPNKIHIIGTSTGQMEFNPMTGMSSHMICYDNREKINIKMPISDYSGILSKISSNCKNEVKSLNLSSANFKTTLSFFKDTGELECHFQEFHLIVRLNGSLLVKDLTNIRWSENVKILPEIPLEVLPTADDSERDQYCSAIAVNLSNNNPVSFNLLKASKK
jgi:hypothetical protein